MPINALREEIDAIDRKIIGLIARRQDIAGRMAREKLDRGIPIHDEARTRQLLAGVFSRAVEDKINPIQVQKIFEILIEMSEERQRECTGDGNLP